MKLIDYLQAKPFVRARRGLGRESDWLDLCELEVPGGVLFLHDPGFLPGAVKGCKVQVGPGRFTVSAKVMTYWKDSRISRLKVSLGGGSPTLGSRIGSAATDLGLIGVADLSLYTAAWERDKDAFKKTLSTEIPESGPCKIATLGAEPGVVVPFVESGFGDGHYSVYALERDGQRVGAEIVFIRAEKPYPFLR